ncbi:hypothetical protein GCM10009117_11430 [Gangjinia marincola]|uniref:Uncharacterized protein n=1 Tax=Gangjinia marincola TaxID=578463 RepID=A0ABN1MGJ1_9FLAO
MANKRELKKELNDVFANIIEAAYLQEDYGKNADNAKVEEIVDECIDAFDALIARINKRDVEDSKKHYKDIRNDFQSNAQRLVEKVNSL